MATSVTQDIPKRSGPELDDKALVVSRRVLETVFGHPQDRTFSVEFWNGVTDSPGAAHDSEFTLRLCWPGALRRMLLPPTDRSVGGAYVRGDIEIEGDMESAARAGWQRIDRMRALGPGLRLLLGLLRLPARGGPPDTAVPRAFRPAGAVPAHSRRRDALAVRFHYDLGNEFFSLFLDPCMQYSCAYFAREGMDLESAQEAKLDLVCRKLRLRPDDRFLDIGCGWGGLVIHAAERYGARATGITLSERQAEWARQSIREAGLEDRCTIELRDYRDLTASERFDKVASIGMIEHVGLRRYPDYFRAAYRLLRPGGLFLNHGIVLRRGHTLLDRLSVRLGRRGSFMHRYIFPDSDLVPLGRTLVEAERVGLEIRDVESLREHYARTLREWLRRLEERRDEAMAVAGAPTWRAWRFYIGACAHVFACGYTSVVQTLLARPASGGTVSLPWTREDLYST